MSQKPPTKSILPSGESVTEGHAILGHSENRADIGDSIDLREQPQEQCTRLPGAQPWLAWRAGPGGYRFCGSKVSQSPAP